MCSGLNAENLVIKESNYTSRTYVGILRGRDGPLVEMECKVHEDFQVYMVRKGHLSGGVTYTRWGKRT